jgi:hypothetical protein
MKSLCVTSLAAGTSKDKISWKKLRRWNKWTMLLRQSWMELRNRIVRDIVCLLLKRTFIIYQDRTKHACNFITCKCVVVILVITDLWASVIICMCEVRGGSRRRIFEGNSTWKFAQATVISCLLLGKWEKLNNIVRKMTMFMWYVDKLYKMKNRKSCMWWSRVMQDASWSWFQSSP